MLYTLIRKSDFFGERQTALHFGHDENSQIGRHGRSRQIRSGVPQNGGPSFGKPKKETNCFAGPIAMRNTRKEETSGR